MPPFEMDDLDVNELTAEILSDLVVPVECDNEACKKVTEIAGANLYTGYQFKCPYCGYEDTLEVNFKVE